LGRWRFGSTTNHFAGSDKQIFHPKHKTEKHPPCPAREQSNIFHTCRGSIGTAVAICYTHHRWLLRASQLSHPWRCGKRAGFGSQKRVRSRHAKRSRSAPTASLLVKLTCFRPFSIGNVDWNTGVHVPSRAILDREPGSNAKSNPFLGRWNDPIQPFWNGHVLWNARWRCFETEARCGRSPRAVDSCSRGANLHILWRCCWTESWAQSRLCCKDAELNCELLVS
jgi:hypothetical protein